MKGWSSVQKPRYLAVRMIALVGSHWNWADRVLFLFRCP